LSGEIMITTLAAEEVEAHLPALIAVLQDSVQGGASVGFLPPLLWNARMRRCSMSVWARCGIARSAPTRWE